MSKSRNWMPLFALLALAVMTVPQPGVAESHEEEKGPGYMTVHFDRVHPSHVAEFEANAKQWVEAFKAAGMGPEWAWQGFSGPGRSSPSGATASAATRPRTGRSAAT